MAQSISNILVHIIFSTRSRHNLITPQIENELYKYISVICKNKGCKLIEIGGTENHIHILVDLSRTITIAKLVAEIKANSSKWIKSKGDEFQYFAWQSGFGVFSIGQSGLSACSLYINRQKQHHKECSFEEEYLKILNKYQVGYNKKYLWDDH